MKNPFSSYTILILSPCFAGETLDSEVMALVLPNSIHVPWIYHTVQSVIRRDDLYAECRRRRDTLTAAR